MASTQPDQLKNLSALDPVLHGETGAILTEGVSLRENADRRKWMLSGDGTDAFLKAAVVGLGTSLPSRDDGLAGDDPCAMWMGLNQWLILSNRNEVPSKLKTAMGDRAYDLVDVSHGWVSVSIEGDLARTLLARGGDLDLHRKVFGPGHFQHAQIAGISLVIHAQERGRGYELIVPRSLAVDLWLWLEETVEEL
ncbi:MAG: sarcosine oxidase subunit gamma family protein [Alphaproteobacteria bacterium]|nr:sarcosine oxidase subunit gamma family protein [Alphaproteobacteria bacterium]